MGFIGYASLTACQFTSETAAHWLSQNFLDKLSLPDKNDMESWCERVFPSSSKGFFIGPYISHYVDQLMNDMGYRQNEQVIYLPNILDVFCQAGTEIYPNNVCCSWIM